MKAYGAEDRADRGAKKTACLRDPQKRKRRALKKKKKRRREELPPNDESTRADYGFDR